MFNLVPEGFEPDKRDFAEAVATLKALPPKTLVYLAKLESLVPRPPD